MTPTAQGATVTPQATSPATEIFEKALPGIESSDYLKTIFARTETQGMGSLEMHRWWY